jgi:hypothetical protein
MGVALAGWWPASKVDEVGAWKGDEQPIDERLRSRNLLASAVESVKLALNRSEHIIQIPLKKEYYEIISGEKVSNILKIEGLDTKVLKPLN